MSAGLQLLIDIDDKGTPKITKFEGRWEGMKKRVLRGSNAIARGWQRARASWNSLQRSVQRGGMLLRYALAGVAAAAVMVGAKFEQSMAKVSSVAGGTREDLRRLSLVARAWGEKTSYSASQAADAMYSLASAGLKTGQIIKAVGGVLLFAGAGATSMGEAAEIVVQALKMFGLEAEQTGRVVNVLAAGISSSMLTADRLKESLAQVGATAASLNQDLETTVGQLGLLHNAGMLSGVAGTRLKNIFVRLAAPGSALREILGDVSLEADGLAGVMQHLADRGTTAGEVYKAFGRIAGPAVLTFMRAGKSAMDDMTKAVRGTQKAQEMYDKQQDTTIGDFKRFKSAVEENMIAAFESIKPQIRDVLQRMTRWTKTLKPTIVGLAVVTWNWIKANKTLLVTLLKIAGTAVLLVPLVKVFRILWGTMIMLQAAGAVGYRGLVMIAQGFGMIRKGVLAVKGALELARIWMILTLGPWGTLAAVAIAALVVIGIYLYKMRDDVHDAFDSMGEWAKRTGTWIWDKIKWPFVKIGELAVKAAGIFKRVFPDAAASVEGMLEVLKDKGGESIDWLGEKGTQGVDAVKGAADSVAGAVTTAFEKAQGAVSGFFGAVDAQGAASIANLPDVSVDFGVNMKKQPLMVSPVPGLPPKLYEDLKDYEKAVEESTARIYQRRFAANVKAADQERAILIENVSTRYAHEKTWLDSKTALIEENAAIELMTSNLTASEIAENRIARDQEIADAQIEHREAVLEHWMYTHQGMMLALDALSVAYDTFFETILDKEMTGKQRREKIWADMKRSFIKNTSEMLKFYVVESVKSILATRAAEATADKSKRLEDAKSGARSAYRSMAAIPIIGPALGVIAAAAAFSFLMAFHQGGMVSGDRREVPGLLEVGEHVTRRSSVNAETRPILEHINATGRAPGGGNNFTVNVNVNGSGGIDIPAVLDELAEQLVPVLEDLNDRRVLQLGGAS